MLKLHNLAKIYQTDEVETAALNGVNIEIEHGEFVAIMGPSGCGKSTLLNVLGMLDSTDSGSFRFLEHQVETSSENQRAKMRKEHIGFIFQSFNLIDELSVEQNIELPLIYHKVPKHERKARVEEVLERVDIIHRRHHLPAKLSGGQQQRVAIARAIVTKPDLILADEPTGNLDSTNSQQVMSLLQDLNREGATIVMVTHAPEHVHFGTRVISLLDGNILSDIEVSEGLTAQQEETACA